MNQPILLYRSGSVYANETTAWAALDAVTHKKGQPIVAFYTLSSPVSGHHGSSTIGAIFAIGIGDGVGQYKACTSHDDMLIVAQSLNAHITQFNQMFEYDANHNAIKAKLDFYTTDGKSISAGGIGSGSSASLGALYQLIDVMANSSNTGVEGAVEGSVLAYDAKAGKWKAIAQSEILPDMSGYYTKDETDSAINTAKSNLQGQVDTLKALIPATASATNPLADKDFVNSSIATATAEFKGSFTSLDELKATSGNLNDYAFYLHTDDVGNKVVDRYKWTTAGWLYEYTLNNSSFTAEQWAALNSTITATLVQSYNSHLNNSTIHITAAERTKWNNKWDYNEETIKGVKVNAAVLADSATKLQTPRTLWGQSFDGSSNVSGNLYLSGYKLVWLGNENYSIYMQNDGQAYYKAYSGHRFYTYGVERLKITSGGNILIGTTTDNGYKLDVNGRGHYSGDLVCGGEVVAIIGEGTPAGVTDYSALTGKPSINGKELASGDNTLDALGIQPKGDYTTASQLASTLENYATKVFVSNNYATKAAVNTIQALIPATATADNQLADKNFVNSSIATATAEFKGSFTSLDELKATSGNLNDYAFYLHTDSVGNSIVDRYKWTTAGWLYEYTLNNSSFTAEQWAALNSAITATLVQSYNSHLNNSTIHITAAERTAWNNKWDYNEETIKGVKVNAAVNADNATSAGNVLFDKTVTILYSGQNLDDYTKGLYGYSNADNPTNSYGDNTAVFAFMSGRGVDTWQIAFDGNGIQKADGPEFAIRGNFANQGWTGWYPIAKISSNVASATKLATARKIWGKYFDGSGNVSGDLTEVGNITASGKATIQGDIISGGEVVAITGEGTPAGVTDYSALTGKPSINGITLVSGNNTLAALGIQAAGDYATNSGVTTLLADYATKVFVSNNYVGKSAFNSHIADTDIHITAAERIAWNAKWNYDEATIKAVKVTSASSADSVAWTGIKDKPSTFTPSAHTHTASEVSGLPTKLSAFTNDVGYITGITKSMVEGVLTGDITSHTHTFTSITSKPTTIAGYGITDALTTSNYNSYSPTLTGTGASGTWGISISGNAATVGGYSVTTNKNTPWGTIPYISTTGIMEVGKHFEFHYDNTTGSDYSTVLTCTGNYGNIVSLPSASGTLALLTDNVASATKLQTPRTLWGQSFDGSSNVSGNLYLSGYKLVWLGNENYSIYMQNDGQAYYKAYSGHRFYTYGVERLKITSGGNILIGTTTDNGYKLQVNGSERVYGDLIVDGEVSALVA